MGRQVRFCLVPADIELLLAELGARHGATLIEAKSDTPNPAEIESPFLEFPLNKQMQRHVSVHCYLVPPGPRNIKMWYLDKLSKWALCDEGSEVIQFSGCSYDGRLLQIGRLYFVGDMLIGDTIWQQRKEFTDWADRVLRTAKKLMRYSKATDAYVGKKCR